MTIAAIKENLKYGDVKLISDVTRVRGMNKGKGYSTNYIQRVLDENDERYNDQILNIAIEIINARRELLQKSNS